MSLPGRTTPRPNKPSATQCPLFGSYSFAELFYIQQFAAAEGWTIPHHPVSGRTNTAFEKPKAPKTER